MAQHAPQLAPQDAQAGSLTPEQFEARAQEFRASVATIREQVGRAIVGQADIVEGVLIALFSGGHVLLEGVPGVGKTLLVRTLARATSLKFSRVQFTPDLMPADITGTTIVSEVEGARGRERVFQFQQGPVFAQIVLADEINRATPKTQSALLEAMQERSVSVGGVTHELPRPFLVMATQNPVEQEGTYPLPEAQLDRFMFKLLSTVPRRVELAEVLARTTAGHDADVRATIDGARICAYQQLVRAVAIAPHVLDYAVRMTLATSPGGSGGEDWSTPMAKKYVRLGASPRGAQALVLGAKCRALMEGRFAASMEDVRTLAGPALRHRLIMNFESHAEGVSADDVVANLVQSLPLEAT